MSKAEFSNSNWQTNAKIPEMREILCSLSVMLGYFARRLIEVQDDSRLVECNLKLLYVLAGFYESILVRGLESLCPQCEKR